MLWVGRGGLGGVVVRIRMAVGGNVGGIRTVALKASASGHTRIMATLEEEGGVGVAGRTRARAAPQKVLSSCSRWYNRCRG